LRLQRSSQLPIPSNRLSVLDCCVIVAPLCQRVPFVRVIRVAEIADVLKLSRADAIMAHVAVAQAVAAVRASAHTSPLKPLKPLTGALANGGNAEGAELNGSAQSTAEHRGVGPSGWSCAEVQVSAGCSIVLQPTVVQPQPDCSTHCGRGSLAADVVVYSSAHRMNEYHY
jgi:hypothetical protein